MTAIVRDAQEVSAPNGARRAGGWGSIWLIYLYSVLEPVINFMPAV